MPDIPGSHAYDVIYRATADFSDLFAQVAAANAAVEELKRNAGDANTSEASSAKAATDAEQARTKALQDGSTAAKDLSAQQALLNRAENNGFNSPQEYDNFKKQSTQTQTLFNQALNNGRTGANAADQVLQDKRNLTAAQNDQNQSLTDMFSAVEDGTKSFTDAHNAEGAFTTGLGDLDNTSKDLSGSLGDVSKGLDDTSKSFGDAHTAEGAFTSGLGSLDSAAKDTGLSLEGIKSGAADASKAFADAHTSQGSFSSGLGALVASSKDTSLALEEAAKANDDLGSSLDKTPARVTAVAKSASAVASTMEAVKAGSEAASTAMYALSGHTEELKSAEEGTSESTSTMKDSLQSIQKLSFDQTMRDIVASTQDLAKSITEGSISSSDASKQIQDLSDKTSDLRANETGASNDLRNAVIPALGDMAKAVNDNSTTLDVLSKAHADETKASDDTAASWRNLFGLSSSLKSGVDDLAKSFDDLAKSTEGSSGSGGGIIGGLSSVLGAGAGGISSTLAAVAGPLSTLLTLLGGIGVVIPIVVTGFAGLAGGIIGVLGALAPLVGIFATFIPIMLGMGEAVAVLMLTIKPLEAAIKDLTSPTTASMAAFDKLSPTMQQAAKDISNFTTALKGMSGDLQGVGTEVLTPLLKPLGELPGLIKPIGLAINGMAFAVGNTLAPILQNVISFIESPSFQTMSKAAAQGIVIFGGTVTSFLDILEKLGTVAAPFMVQMAQLFNDWAAGMNAAVTAGTKSGGLADFFTQMVTAAKELAAVIGAVLTLVGALGEGLAPLGNDALKSVASGIESIATAMSKVDWATWVGNAVKFWDGLDTAISGVWSLLASFENSKFLDFLGAVLSDVGQIARALDPVAKFITEIGAGAVEDLKPAFDAIKDAVVAILDPIDKLLNYLGQIKPLMEVLSAGMAVLIGAAISASMISFFSTLLKISSEGVNSLIMLLNKLPGVNIGSVGNGETLGSSSETDAGVTALNAAADKASLSLDALAASADRAAGADDLDSVAGDKLATTDSLDTVAGDKMAVGETTDAGGGLMSGAGSKAMGVAGGALLAVGGNQLANQYTAPGSAANTAAKTGSDVAGGALAGTSIAPGVGTAVGAAVGLGVGTSNTAAAKDAPTVVHDIFDPTAWDSDFKKGWAFFTTDLVKPIGSWVSGIAATMGTSIGGWFSSAASWFNKDVTNPVKTGISTFTGFFTNTIPQWFDAAATAFTRDVTNPVKTAVATFTGFFTNTIPQWFTTALSFFQKDVYDPIKNWVTNDFVGFYTSTIPRWFSIAASAFMNAVYTPIKNWVTNDFVGFFTSTIPKWFSTAETWFMNNVYTPVKNWINNDFVGFFTSTIPKWFASAQTWFMNDVYTPVKNWVTNDFVAFFTDTIPKWFSTAVTWFTTQVYNPVKQWVENDFVSFFTTTIPRWFSTAASFFTNQVYNPVKQWVENDFVGFFTSTIPRWFSSAAGEFTSQVYNPVKNWVENDFVGFFTSTIPHWFSNVGTYFTQDVIDPITKFFAGIGNTIVGSFKSAINAVISDVINPVIDLINVALKIIPGAPTIGKVGQLAGGGHVAGDLSEPDDSDSQLYRLTPGEYVIRKRAAQALGPQALDALNNADRQPIPASSLPFMNVAPSPQIKTNGEAGSRPAFAAFAKGGAIRGYAGGGTTGGGDATNSGGTAGIDGSSVPTQTPPSGTGVSISGIVGDVTGWAKSLVLGAMKDAFDAGWNTLAVPVINKMTGSDQSIPQAIVKTGTTGFKSGMDTFLGASDKKTQASADIGGTVPSGDQKTLIDSALQADGIPSSAWATWEAGLNTLITRESSWNASAVNNVDSNAAAGTPSEGLAQVIAPTFAAYRNQSLPNDLLNPEANIAAAVNYINATYGGIGNVQQANANLPPKGYASGGLASAASLTSGMNFAMPNAGGFANGGAIAPSVKSAAASSANGGLSGPGVHIENMNISNPLPERVGDSLQRRLTQIRVYNANQS